MKKLPIGIATFEKLIQENYVYVDKTALLHKLITLGAYYFLSRPRRFGKSLTISTLEAIFSGRKELFAGLAISKTDYDWPVHPVIRLDLAAVAVKTPEELEGELCDKVRKIAVEYGVALPQHGTSNKLFEDCVSGLAKKNKVVLLIDEYDKPITDHITDTDLANKMRDVMGNFYGVIKALDDHLKFVFITGVSRFARMSIFSRLNNLEDITMDKMCSAIVGYTERELVENFDDYIAAFATHEGISKAALVDQLRDWYDGYCFHPDVPEKLYSPQTVMNALKKQEFSNYWLATGGTSFVVKLVKKNNYELVDLENKSITELDMMPGDTEKLSLAALLLQTGYLTIKERDKAAGGYKLGYPNAEIRAAFIGHVAAELLQGEVAQFNTDVYYLRQKFEAGDVEGACKRLYTFFAGIPFKMKLEKHYHLVLYALFRAAGAEIIVEDPTNIGCIDITLQTPDRIFLIELKRNASAQKALDQILERKYYEKFMHQGKKIVLVGLAFKIKERNLSDWVVKEL